MNWTKSFCDVTPGVIDKCLTVPSSKSYANRALCLAAIDKRPVSLGPVSDANDVTTMISCLERVGLNIKKKKGCLSIINSFPECEQKFNPLPLNTGDGGTTNRFLMALLSRGRRPYILHPSGRIKERPMDELIGILISLGVRVECCPNAWVRIQGPYKNLSSEINVDCSKTTQFFSALSVCLADSPIVIHQKKDCFSMPYLRMSKFLVEEFRQGKKHYTIPTDFSCLGYPLALGMTHGQAEIINVGQKDDLQADSCFIDLAKQMGASISLENSRLKVQSGQALCAISFNASACPDLVPTLAYVCSCAQGTSKVSGLDILRYKESDRLRETLRLLEAFDVNFQLDDKKSTLEIVGSSPRVSWVEYHPPEDHRMVMSAYLFMRKNSGGRIHNIQAVRKSFPHFFEALSP